MHTRDPAEYARQSRPGDEVSGGGTGRRALSVRARAAKGGGAPPRACVHALVVLLTMLTIAPAQPAQALCGDMSRDGFVTATDALATLSGAVAGSYDAIGDIDSGAGADGFLRATDALAVLNSAVATEIPLCAAASATHAAVLTASFLFDASGIALIDFATLTPSFRGGAFHKDSVLRTQGGRLFGVNRFGANSLLEIDYESPGLPTLKECSVAGGFNSNSHDVVLLSPDKGYVSAYESPDLFVIDPSALDPATNPACDGAVSGFIDLSGLADADGLPEMDQMVVAGDRLFVSLQMLVHSGFFEPASPARLAVIDTERDEIAGVIDLELENPFAETKGIVYDETLDRVYLGGPGLIFLDFEDGGIEAVDVAAMQSQGLLISGKELGGDLFDFAVVGSRRAYAIVAESDGANVLLEVDLAAGEVVDELVRTTALSDIPLADIEVTQSGQLWVAFREDLPGSAPGIRIFSIADNTEITPVPIFPGDLPFNIVFVETD